MLATNRVVAPVIGFAVLALLVGLGAFATDSRTNAATAGETESATDFATLDEAGQVALALRAIAGEPVQDDIGRFPREAVGQARYLKDRCSKVSTLPPARTSEVEALRAALVGTCASLLKLSGMDEEEPKFPGDAHRPSRLETSPEALKALADAARGTTGPIFPLLERAESAVDAKSKENAP